MAKSERQVVRGRPESGSRVSFRPNFSHKSMAIATTLLLLLVGVLIVLIEAVKKAPTLDLKVSSKGLSELQFTQLNKQIQKEKGANYFSADLVKIRDVAQNISWIKEVSVTRDWHKGILVKALARQPVARFGSQRLVDAKGEVFEPVSANGLTEYPLVSIQGEPEQVNIIMAQMQLINAWYSPLGMTVEDIILTPRMTWLIRFDSGLRILVDGENTAQKLMNVSQVLQNQLEDKRNDIQSIDMRYRNGFAISWKNGKKPS